MNITHSLLIEGDEDNAYVLSWQTCRSGPGPDKIRDALTSAAKRYCEESATDPEFPPEGGLNVGDIVNSTGIVSLLGSEFEVYDIDLVPVCRPLRPWSHDLALVDSGQTKRG